MRTQLGRNHACQLPPSRQPSPATAKHRSDWTTVLISNKVNFHRDSTEIQLSDNQPATALMDVPFPTEYEYGATGTGSNARPLYLQY